MRRWARLAPPGASPAWWTACTSSRPKDRTSIRNEDRTMNNLRLLDPNVGDSFETAVRRFFAPTAFEADAPQTMKMRIDVTENDKAYTVKADIPGVKKDDITVRVEGNMVSIEAEAKGEKESKGNGDKVLRTERYYGSVS